MRDVLQQLSQIPGVVGSLACSPRGELLASAFPPLFDELTLHRLSGLLAEDTAGIAKVAGPGGSFDLRFARGRALVRPFRAGTLLVVGTAQSDAQLLGLSIEQALRRLEEAGDGGGPEGGPPVDEVRSDLREALVREIGPFGEIALDEAWTAWTAAGAPSRARLPELVSRLAAEIDDEAGRARFLAVAHGLGGAPGQGPGSRP